MTQTPQIACHGAALTHPTSKPGKPTAAALEAVMRFEAQIKTKLPWKLVTQRFTAADASQWIFWGLYRHGELEASGHTNTALKALSLAQKIQASIMRLRAAHQPHNSNKP